MKRSRGLKKAAQAILTAMFLVAALASTGCGKDSLLNPVSGDDAVSSGSSTGGQSGRELHPSGREAHP